MLGVRSVHRRKAKILLSVVGFLWCCAKLGLPPCDVPLAFHEPPPLTPSQAYNHPYCTPLGAFAMHKMKMA